MLEESLQSNTIPPSEIAKSFSIFLKQDYQFGDNISTNASTLADKRFTNVVSLLIKRLFQNDNNFTAWLSFLYHWDINYTDTKMDDSDVVTMMYGMISNLYKCSEYQLEKDDIIKLLSIDKTNSNITLMNVFLYQGMRYDYNKKFEVMLDSLPKPTQKIILESELREYDGSMIIDRIDTSPRTNAKRLIELLGNITPPDSNKESSPNRSLFRTSPRWTSTTSPMRSSPKMSPSSKLPTEPKKIMLNMLEYFILSFVSFPRQKRTTSKLIKILQPNYMYGNTAYIFLFKMYLDYFISSATRDKLSPFATSSNDIVSKSTELFLRMLIEYWLDGENGLYITSESMQRLHMEKDVVVPLSSAFELVQSTFPQFDYTPNPPLVSQCVQIMTKSLLLDYISSIKVIGGMALTPCMRVIQPSLFNHIRMLIKYAPMVQYGDHCPFLDIVDIWLLWLEPWNVTEQSNRQHLLHKYVYPYCTTANNTNITKGGLFISVPSIEAPSAYTSQWKNYIASNYHFYTHILAIFIKRACELDFSKISSYLILQRVIRVFSPFVVSELYSLSHEQTPVVNNTMDQNQGSHALKEEHNKRLGEYCPPNSPTTLFASCVDDIKYLLQNAVKQYQVLCQTPCARVILCSTQLTDYSSLPTEESIYKLATDYKALLCNQVPLDLHDILSTPTTSQAISTATISSILETITSKFDTTPPMNDEPERNGIYLTKKGREEIFNGIKTSKPYQSTYIGDPMKANIQDYEISFMVHLTLRLSYFLNDVFFGIKDTFALEKKVTSLEDLIMEQELYENVRFRVNLRFLADYRNLIFILFVFGLWKLFF